MEREKAKERQSTLNNGESLSQKSDTANKGRASDKAAKQSGFGSRDTYSKAKFVGDNADEDMITKLDDGQLSVNRA